ncbi:MAG TPA: DUF1573 domain-containing protein [Spirochaetota bacterium]|nr:DUF1573 domain-containing protein [Spirochaetota bacterium]HQP49868.1 DUF1573 domain-containing protein [Spirochaetota bacterium]
MNSFKNAIYFFISATVFIATICIGAPNAEIESPTHNFGQLNRLSTVRHVFVLKNTGTSNLVIKKIEAG